MNTFASISIPWLMHRQARSPTANPSWIRNPEIGISNDCSCFWSTKLEINWKMKWIYNFLALISQLVFHSNNKRSITLSKIFTLSKTFTLSKSTLCQNFHFEMIYESCINKKENSNWSLVGKTFSWRLPGHLLVSSSSWRTLSTRSQWLTICKTDIPKLCLVTETIEWSHT